MTASILTRVLVALSLTAASPVLAAHKGDCERAVAKASTKFVGAAFKIGEHCLSRAAANRLPVDACRLSADTTGGGPFGGALGNAQRQLGKGLSACADAKLQSMGFDVSCGSSDSTTPMGRAGLESCIARTHLAAVQTLLNVEFPQLGDGCGNGVVDDTEDCDPSANPTGCDTGETCVAAGLPDECTCVDQNTPVCGDGVVQQGEACDPGAQPTGCAAGMICGAAGNANQCTCVQGPPSECTGSCTPDCGAGQTCVCHCAAGPGSQCGNGKVDSGEQCDPAASPTGCFTGETCDDHCTCSGGACGNGRLDPGEACDPAATPTGCIPGKICGAAGTSDACHCLKPGTACGDGRVEATEQCDPAANPTGCPSGQTCSTECKCSGTGGAQCGNGTIDPGELCDPTANPTGCPAGTTCGASCTCAGGGGGGGATLSFTTALGTANCGGGGLASPPAAPASGEIDSDTAGSSKISDLGLGCLYFGGGSATIVPPGRIPDGATSTLSVSGSALSASAGTGPNDCTRGAGPSKKCANDNAEASCSSDADCGGSAGSCAPVANCFFGPPLPILSPPPSDALTTCVMNVVQTDAGGTVDTASGASSVSLPLTSRVYITGNTASPCPTCAGGACSYGKNPGASCTATGSLGTSNDCPPDFTGFQAPLPVNLTPLTSGTAEETAADGKFCPGQTHAGAFGKAAAKRVAETGTPAGALTDGAAHPSVLAAAFCIPKTGNIAVDGVADLPGPGAIGLNGTAQLHQ